MESKEKILEGCLDNFLSDTFGRFFKEDVLIAMEEYATLRTKELEGEVERLKKELERSRAAYKELNSKILYRKG